MKNKKNSTPKSPHVVIDNELAKYDNMPVFQNKMDIATAFLEKNPPPEALLKEMKNRRIKRHFEQNMSIEQIAERLSLTKADVLLCIQELGLLETVE